MNGIEIRTGPEEPEEKGRPIAALLFLEAGVFGVLFLFHSLKGISFSEGVVYPVTALLCWAVWFTCYGSRRACLSFLAASVAVYGAAVFGMEDILRDQLRYIAGCILGGSKTEPMEVTEAVLLMVELFTFFAAMSEFLIRSHMVLYLLTTALLLLAPLLGIRANAGTVLLLALFQAAFWILQTDGLIAWRLSFGGVKKRPVMGKSSLVAGAVMALVFLVMLPLVYIGADTLYTGVYKVEDQVYRTISHLTGRDDAPVTGGTVGRGNQYRTGTPHLELESDEKPEEPLYLCGFQGDEYIGGGWSALGEGELFETVEEKLGWQAYSNGRFSAGNLYSSMYFMMNTNRQSEEVPEWRSLKISHRNGNYESLYIPYYSQRGWGWAGGFFEGYLFWYYEQQDMNVAWDNVWEEFSVIRDWYRELRDAYKEEIQVAYTKVPLQLLPRLTNLCSVNHWESLEEITAFILNTLHENAEYTMTPGWSPVNEDIVEYFLFESGRGYCEHFASAAALMYRLYGIPARYASGYLVQPSAFELQPEGIWKATVTDREAHAWVEIFLEDYGWTPVEVTPAAGGSFVADYPGFDGTIFRRIVAEKGWDRETPGLLTGMEPPSEPGWQMPEKLLDISFGEHERWQDVLRGCAVYTLCLCPLFLDYRRLRLLKKMEGCGSRRIFARLLEMLHDVGLLEGYDGTETDFAERLEEVTGVSGKEITRMLETVSEAAYGRQAEGSRGEEGVRRVCRMLSEAVWRQQKWYKRLLLRYWKAYL